MLWHHSPSPFGAPPHFRSPAHCVLDRNFKMRFAHPSVWTFTYYRRSGTSVVSHLQCVSCIPVVTAITLYMEYARLEMVFRSRSLHVDGKCIQPIEHSQIRINSSCNSYFFLTFHYFIVRQSSLHWIRSWYPLILLVAHMSLWRHISITYRDHRFCPILRGIPQKKSLSWLVKLLLHIIVPIGCVAKFSM